jgi:hypothetical protein
MMYSNFKITNWSFYCLAILISSVIILNPPINTFSYDVFGYYMYLPLTFKYNDITIQHISTIDNILKTYHASETFYQAVKWDNGSWVMRYPIGLSVLFSPFYFISDAITQFTDYPRDGFSRPYQLGVLYGCLFYTLIGLYFVKKILTSFFNDRTSALTMICIVLGTNYFFHVSLHGQGVMSHNLLFSMYAIIIYLTIKWHQSFSVKHIILLGIFTGITALCRPSEIICLIIPIFYGVYNLNTLKAKASLLINYKKQIFLFIILISSIGFIQFGYWKYASGHFIINPYGAGNPGEGLELLQPHILKVLFSFRKGWFIYTPLMLFTMIGFWQMHKHNKLLFLPVFFYFIINFYIVSCWSCWWYGSCFGVRSLIPSYAVLTLPLGYFICFALKDKFKYFYSLFIFLFIILNLFQSWQMTVGIMDPANMSRAYYFSTFLQTSKPTPEQSKLLLKGKFNDGIEIFTKEDSLTHILNYAQLINFETKSKDINSKFLSDSIHHSGKLSIVTNIENPYSSNIEVPFRDISKKSYTWIKASIWLYSNYPADSLNATFIIELRHKGYIFKQKLYPLNNANFKSHVWNNLEYYYFTPDDLRSTKDLVRTYFWNRSPHTIYVDDLMMQSYEPIIDKSVF